MTPEHRRGLLVVVAAFLVGVLGYVAPGCYADWGFLRVARLQGEQRAAQQEIGRLRQEIQQLKEASAAPSIEQPQ